MGALKMQDLTMAELLLPHPAMLARQRNYVQLCYIRP